MKQINLRPIVVAALATLFLVIGTGGCVYYNTFYNARKAFNEAEDARKNAKGGRGGEGQYRVAIEKALKVVESYPNSKWYDDALYVLGVSYFRTGQYIRADRRFRELLANYEDSPYVRDATLYLAKSKLQLGEEAEAMVIFEDIFRENYKRKLKGEAAVALGDFYFEAEKYDQARVYYRAVRDSLGTEEQKKLSQRLIADAFFNDYEFGEALGAYLQLLGKDPDPDERYHALFQAAQCSYKMQRIDDGLDYLDQLIKDDLYYDSLGVLKLQVAEGYEMEEDMDLAEVTYDDIATSTERKNIAATAFYRLGLIYQYDYDDLAAAKEYYDKAVEANRATESGRLALQKSSDIGKLETYARVTEVDTTNVEEFREQAAETQFLLSELYWFQLNKPDSAIVEMEYLVDSFPDTRIAPSAIIALSRMYQEYTLDSLAADSMLKSVLTEYPHSDYIPDALDLLGLRGTAADTGYAGLYLSRAEEFYLQGDHIDSAVYYYRYIVDSFPDSKYALQAQFSALYVQEMSALPGDSSLVYAYQEIVDSFSGTDWAREASRRIAASRPRQARPADLERDEELEELGDERDTLYASDDVEGSYADVQLGIYLRPNGDTVAVLEEEPVLIEEDFEFPVEASSMKDDYILLYFQILLDFSGKVIDTELRVPSLWDEMNVRAERTVRSMTFDALEVSRLIDIYQLPPDSKTGGHWFVFKYRVDKPEALR